MRGRRLRPGQGPSPASGQLRLGRWLAPLAWLGVSIVGVLLLRPLVSLPERALYLIACAAVAAALLTVRVAGGGSTWSGAFVYLFVFCVFHFGLTTVVALGLPLPDEFRFVMEHYWPEPGAVRHAVVSSMAGLAACVAGVLAARLFPHRQLQASRQTDPREENAIALAGFLLAAGSIGIWFVRVVAMGGISLLFSSYTAFLQETRDARLSLLYFTMGLGVVFASSVRSTPLRTATYAVFAGFALVAFPLGLRGEVLFPTFAALATTARPPRASIIKASVLAVALLTAISLVRGLRTYGLRDVGESVLEASPHAALAELGGTIRPVAEVISWADDGEAFLYGASYWAPFDRALHYVVPGWERPDAASDERLLNVVIQRRRSAIGFSPIAEAHRNFGDAGVVGFMLLLGVVVGRMDYARDSTRRRLKRGIVLLPLLIFVRNSFTPVPAEIVVGFATYAATLVLAGRRLTDRH